MEAGEVGVRSVTQQEGMKQWRIKWDVGEVASKQGMDEDCGVGRAVW